MDYQKLTFNVTSGKDDQQDLLINTLAQIGFDSFETIETGFKAYTPIASFRQDHLNDTLKSFKDLLSFSYTSQLIPAKNWNEVWESNFSPILIRDTCYIRATFHEPHPEYPYEIIIDPKMAFGTGHHQTTKLMIQWMLEHHFDQKTVLDMGSGTGILAILTSKLGANQIVAIDNDINCLTSTIQNAKINQADTILAFCGSKEVIPPNLSFDVILANMNRVALLDQIDTYASILLNDGTIFLSGFYEGHDLDLIIEKAQVAGLEYIAHNLSENWAAAKFIKRK